MRRKTPSGLVAGAALLWLAGCGGFSTPDLAHGAIEGRVVGASLDAYAYPFGAPGLAAKVAADGRFRIDGLATGPVKLLVYDDSRADGTRRAELVDLVVVGGAVARFERNGERAPVADPQKMAPAGSLVATVALQGGGLAVAPRFTVVGTDLAASPLPGQVAVALGQLPAATNLYRLTAAESGYRPAELAIDLAIATSAFDVPLQIETAGEGPRGCGAIGDRCLTGLRCDATSGRCVQCLGDGDCAPGATCDQAEQFCTSPVGSLDQGGLCASCSADSQCRGGPLTPARCERSPLASTGFCTWAPASDSTCPAGFTYLPDAAGTARCLPAISCAAYFARFGQGCLTEEGCRGDGAIVGGVCQGADPAIGQVGFCTVACHMLGSIGPADTCVAPGSVCDPVLAICQRP